MIVSTSCSRPDSNPRSDSSAGASGAPPATSAPPTALAADDCRLRYLASTRRAIMGEIGDAPAFISTMVCAMSSGAASLWM
jgi:hypothetical protein